MTMTRKLATKTVGAAALAMALSFAGGCTHEKKAPTTPAAAKEPTDDEKKDEGAAKPGGGGGPTKGIEGE